VSGADDYGSQGYPPDGHDAAGGKPAYELDGGPDQLDSSLLDDEDYAQCTSMPKSAVSSMISVPRPSEDPAVADVARAARESLAP
jgi:hypothetical protein